MSVDRQLSTARELDLDSALSALNPDREGRRSAKCPAHADKNRSFTYRDDGKGYIQLKCHAGCSYDQLADALEARGFIIRRKKLQAVVSSGRFTPDGIKYSEKFGDFVCWYVYQNEDGSERFRCARFSPKTFRQGAYSNAEGRFIWSLKDVELVPYRLPKLIEAGKLGKSVLLLEGEKDAETAEALGFVATTLPMGAGKEWKSHYGTALIGCKVIVICDNDREPLPTGEYAGEKHGNKVASNLRAVGIPVKMTMPPGGYKDLTDWVDAGGTAEELKEFLKSLKPWQPPGGIISDPVIHVPLHVVKDGAPAPKTPKPEPVERIAPPPVTSKISQLTSRGFHVDTDAANAERLEIYYGDTLRHTEAAGFMHWDGARWRRDEGGARAQEAARDISRRIIQEISLAEHEVRDRLQKWAKKSMSVERIKAIITLGKMREGIHRDLSDFDGPKTKFLLNCLNGTVDLKTGEIRPHDREDHITKITPYNYNPEATCPKFHKFLDRITGGDRELKQFLIRLFGYFLTGAIGEQVVPFFYGHGANGKSQLVNVMTQILGEYSMNCETASLMQQSQPGIRNDLARLVGARLVTASETNDGQKFDEALIKRISGGDVITARFLNHENFDFTPNFKLLLQGNHKPRISGGDFAIQRRMLLVPFTVTIPDEEKIPHLANKLVEEEGEGILALAVAGCLEWQRTGLKSCEAIRAASKQYMQENDIIGTFLDERCLRQAGLNIPCKDLYIAYKQWCLDNGFKPFSAKRLGVELSERKISIVDNWYQNLQLN